MGWPWKPSLKLAEGSKPFRAPTDLLQTKESASEKKGNLRNSTGTHSQGHTAASLKVNRAQPPEYHGWEERQSGGRHILFCFSQCHGAALFLPQRKSCWEGSRKTGKLSHNMKAGTTVVQHSPCCEGPSLSCAPLSPPRGPPHRPLPWLAQSCPNHPGLLVAGPWPPTLALITQASLPCHLRSAFAAITAREPSCGPLFLSCIASISPAVRAVFLSLLTAT